MISQAGFLVEERLSSVDVSVSGSAQSVTHSIAKPVI